MSKKIFFRLNDNLFVILTSNLSGIEINKFTLHFLISNYDYV